MSAAKKAREDALFRLGNIGEAVRDAMEQCSLEHTHWLRESAEQLLLAAGRAHAEMVALANVIEEERRK